LLVLAAPLAAAVISAAFGDEVPLQGRALAIAGLAAALGGAAWGAVRSISGSVVAWSGSFAMDPLRAALVFGALLVSAAAVARAEEAPRPSLARAGVLAAIGASLAPLVVTGSHLLAVTLPLGTAGVALAGYATAAHAPNLLRAVRSVVVLALSDALALVGIALSVGKGTAFPPSLSTLAASLLLAAALIRLGLITVAGPTRDAEDSHPAAGLLWLGPIRAQGFLLVVYAVGAHRGIAYAAAAAAALAILVAGVTAATRENGASLAAIGAGVAVLGFALGGATPTWGAALAVLATFAGASVWAGAGAWSAVARTTLASLPAGGLIAGSALVVGAALEAGVREPWFLALAVPAAAGLLAAAASAWTSARTPAHGAAAFAGVIGVAACLALAVLPVRAASWLGEPVARSLGVGRLLSVGGEPGVAAGLAIVVLGVAIIAFLAGPGRIETGATPEQETPPVLRADGFAAAAPATDATRQWAFAAMFLLAVSVGIAVRVYITAAQRGFL
jgi:hypothetical protein